MSPYVEDNVLNKVEIVLPRNVVETCYLLPTGVGTEFLSTNNARATFTRTHVFKSDDESVRLQITGKNVVEEVSLMYELVETHN